MAYWYPPPPTTHTAIGGCPIVAFYDVLGEQPHNYDPVQYGNHIFAVTIIRIAFPVSATAVSGQVSPKIKEDSSKSNPYSSKKEKAVQKNTSLTYVDLLNKASGGMKILGAPSCRSSE